MGKILLNGIEYSGLSVINGLFIDTANVITSGTITAGSSVSYTATADCAFDFLAYSSGGSNAFLQIDGKNIFTSSAGTNRNTFLVKKGQTVTAGSYGTNGSYTVYRLMQGSNVSGSSVNYSTTEQVIGTWIDGKTVYQRVFDFGSDLVISNTAFTNTTVDASNMQTLIYALGIYSTGATIYNLMPNINNNLIRLQSDRNNGSANVRYLILRYTKITD